MSNKEEEEILRLSLGELRERGIKSAIGDAVESYLAVLFLARTDGKWTEGSGVFVKYKELYGILTASHVIAFMKHLFMPSILRLGTTDVWEINEIQYKQIISIDDPQLYLGSNWSEEGLDITLIQFDEKVFNALLRTMGKKFIDLEDMKNCYDAQPSKYWLAGSNNDWIWVVLGVPRQNPQLIAHESNPSEKNIIFFPSPGVYIGGGECKHGNIPLTRVIQEYQGVFADLIISQLGPTLDTLPSRFHGASGGGCIQVLGKLVEDQFVVTEFQLAGIVVAQGGGGYPIKGTYIFIRDFLSLFGYKSWLRFLGNREP